jgi:predicted amidohydrolase YtcJ
MLLTNGRMHTLDARDTVADALLVRDGRLGVLPSMQPGHCTSDMRRAEARLGAARLPDGGPDCPEHRIPSIVPMLTMADGAIVYRRGPG